MGDRIDVQGAIPHDTGLCQEFVERDSGGGLCAVPTIDTRRATFFKVQCPLSDAVRQALSECYTEAQIASIETQAREAEAVRLHNRQLQEGKLDAQTLDELFGAQFTPVTHMLAEELHEPRCVEDAKRGRLYALATHMPPLSLDLLQQLAYCDLCIRQLCDSICEYNALTQLRFSFFYDVTDNHKVYFFLSVFQPEQ